MSRLYRVGRVWYADLRGLGGGRVSTRCTDRRAAEVVVRRLERLAADPRHAAAETTTLGDAFGMMLAERKARGRAAGTLKMHASKAGHFVRLWGEHLPIGRVDAALVDDYIAQRQREGVTRHTIGKELVTLRVTLKLARRRGEFPHPLDEVLPVAWETGYQPRKTALTLAQFDALCLAAPPRVANWARFYAVSTARYAAAARAQPGDLDTERGLCLVRGTKTDTAERIVPVVPWLRSHAEAITLPLYPYTNAGLRKALHRVCDRANVPRVTGNDLRRSAGTWLRERRADASLVGTFLGHSGPTMAMRVYARLDGETLAAAIGEGDE